MIHLLNYFSHGKPYGFMGQKRKRDRHSQRLKTSQNGVSSTKLHVFWHLKRQMSIKACILANNE